MKSSPTYRPGQGSAQAAGYTAPSPVAPAARGITVRGLGLNGWRGFTVGAVVAAAASLGFIAWTMLRIGGDQATIAVDDLGEALAALVATSSCWFAAYQTAGRTRLAWALLGASAFSWGAGEVVWSVYEVGMNVPVPFPSAADVGFLIAVPLTVAGVLAFTSAPSRLATRGEALLAGAIVALSLLFVAWALGLGMVYATSSASPAAQLIGLAYPVGDIITITVLVLALRRARRTELGRLFLILGGLASAALANSAFAYLTATGLYHAIGSVLDAGWVVGYLMIAVAPLWPSAGDENPPAEGPIALWQLALPWTAVLAASLVAVRLALADHSLDRFATVLAGGIGILLVGSQVLSHRDSLTLLVKSQRAEGALAGHNRLLDEIVSHAPLGIARVGLDMKIIDVNPRLASLLRTKPNEMVGTTVGQYLQADELARVAGIFQTLWHGAVDSIESDSRALRADHTEVWLHWSATVVRTASGRVDYFLAMYEDTDAEHAANEAAAAHLAGIERLNQLKSEFISLVSHEFRTALVGIQGFSEMIRDEDISIVDAKGFAADINKDALRLNRMINDMLDLDRIEAGRLTLVIEPVSINDLLSRAADRARASSAKHTVTCDLDARRPMVRCDADRISQVVANLLNNAVKYSPAGGDITVTSRAGASQVEVSVRDHGVGIAADFVPHLFSRYERYEKMSGKITGTGLGLAIAKEIVEHHGGKIWVDSEQGKGSDFHFTLPRTVAATSLPAPAQNDAAAMTGSETP
ncbi:MAG TPA: PAS domain-containing sensor histidine kinase [Candidatus Dormibacteraeota bacterium]